MGFREIFAVAALILLPSAAYPDPAQGLYISLDAGLDYTQAETARPIGPFVLGNFSLAPSIGGLALGSMGWGFGNGFRSELELSYRYNGVNAVNAPPANTFPAGSEQKFGPMLNILYDFSRASDALTPYIGAGLGYQLVYESGGLLYGHETAGAFAYQGMLGIAAPLAIPGLAVTGEYRFLGATGDRDYSGVKLGNDYNHSVLIGLRYAFGARSAASSSPIMGSVPMSRSPRSYLLFFDWDNAELTDRARQVVADAAANASRLQYTELEVDGYADASDALAYYKNLSLRRAHAVATELVKDGVPGSTIEISGFGESHRLLPAAPSANQPNRRVEIIVR